MISKCFWTEENLLIWTFSCSKKISFCNDNVYAKSLVQVLDAIRNGQISNNPWEQQLLPEIKEEPEL